MDIAKKYFTIDEAQKGTAVISNKANLEAANLELEKEGKAIDLLVNSAGIAHPGPLWELDTDIIKKTIDNRVDWHHFMAVSFSLLSA